MWESLVQDVAFGARILRRQPGFTSVAVLALSLDFGPAHAQCNPVFNTTSALPSCVGLQQLPITVPSGQTITVIYHQK